MYVRLCPSLLILLIDRFPFIIHAGFSWASSSRLQFLVVIVVGIDVVAPRGLGAPVRRSDLRPGVLGLEDGCSHPSARRGGVARTRCAACGQFCGAKH